MTTVYNLWYNTHIRTEGYAHIVTVLADVHSTNHITIRIMEDEGYLVSFDFNSVFKRTNQLVSDISVKVNTEEPYNHTINILSSPERESLARNLTLQFGNTTGLNWTKLINQAYSNFRDEYSKLTASVVIRMRGDNVDKPIPFLIDNYIVDESGTFLFGPPGKGKSWTALIMAVSVDAGISKAFKVSKQCPVLYINLERSESSMQRRLGKVNAALGLEATREILFINKRGSSLDDIIDAIRQSITLYKVGLVVIDSISRAGAGDLTTNETGNQIIDILNSLNIAWLGIGHSPRNSDEHIFGTVMQDAAADVMIAIKSKPVDMNELLISLHVMKANDFATPSPKSWVFHMNEFGILGIEIDDRVNEMTLNSPAQIIGDYLVEVGQATATQISKVLDMDRANVSRILKQQFKMVEQQGRLKFYGVN